MGRNMADRNYPCCLPVDYCPPPIPPSAPFTFSYQELEGMPKCEGPWPEQRNQCITIQQPPKLIMRKKFVTTRKKIFYPEIVKGGEETIKVPTITEKERIIQVPMVTWQTKMLNVPKIHWYPSYVSYPKIICVPRVSIEPKEICQTILCQPKPQIIDIPPPTNFCLYESGAQTLRCTPPCPPIPPPPCPPYPACKDAAMMGFSQ